MKTVSYWNEEYLIPESYANLDLDIENGQDINSEIYCSVGYGIFRSYNAKIVKPTLSLNSLEIGIDIKNNTNTSYYLDKVVLNPVSKTETNIVEGVAGKYEQVTPASGYMGSVTLSVSDFNNKSTFHAKGENFTVNKAKEIADSRIRIIVQSEKKMTGKGYKILKFDLEMHLISLSADPKSLIVKSDKTYVMAFE